MSDNTSALAKTLRLFKKKPPIQCTADVVLFSPDGFYVLLIQRRWDPYEGYWALPGGYVDPGEQPLDAAVRELREETGVRIDAVDLRELGTWDAPGRDPRGRYSTTAFVGAVPAETKIVAATDAADVRWWPVDELPELAFDHRDIHDQAQVLLA